MQPTDTASEHAAHDERAPAGGRAEESTESVSLGSLSWTSRLIVALAIGTLGVYTLFHLAVVFLFVAPSNTLREKNEERIEGYIYPEFEQNWKLFAPNPLQRDESVHVRAEYRDEDGALTTTDWIDLTAMDLEGIEHRLLPSHTAQNMLRRAWDLYDGSHDDEGDPIGWRGELAGRYVHRLALLRLEDQLDLTSVERIQLRSAATRVPAPDWRREDFDLGPFYDEQPWWVVTTQDLPEGARDREAQ